MTLHDITYTDLQECRRMNNFINDETERMYRLESQIERITTAMKIAGGGGSGASDKMAEDIATLLDMRDALWDAIINRKEKIDNIRIMIAGLPDEQRRILELRYFDGLTWNTIAKRTNYDRRHCFRLHRLALVKLGIFDQKRIGKQNVSQNVT